MERKEHREIGNPTSPGFVLEFFGGPLDGLIELADVGSVVGVLCFQPLPGHWYRIDDDCSKDGGWFMKCVYQRGEEDYL